MTFTLEEFYYIVTALDGFTICILTYLFFVNIVARMDLKNCAPSLIWNNTKACLCYLRIFHINSVLIIITLLLKHLHVLSSYRSCQIVNQVYMVGNRLGWVLIWLVWQSRHEAMSVVLSKEKSKSALGAWLVTRFLVISAFITLPFDMSQFKTQYSEDDRECIQWTPVWYDHIHMYISVSVCLIFSILFVAQLYLAFRRIRDELTHDLLSLETITDASSITPQKAKSVAIRNVMVIFFTMLWMFLFYGTFNYKEPTGGSLEYYIYSTRLVLVLGLLTNNVALYFVFREWYFFLCYPCCSKQSRRSAGLSLADTDYTSSLYSSMIT